MTTKFLSILLLALFATSLAQSDDGLHIPEENDNQFPPVVHPEVDVSPIEGSGAEEHLETTTLYSESPPLEDVQLSSSIVNNESVPTSDKLTCPTKCICNIEGDSNEFVVDCSDAELTELPTPLDAKTTQLKLQNNKLTIIPKEISVLKHLKILNLNNNKIMEVAAGSISELPELTSLTLENNRLMEYPTDFKNGFGLTKLQEFNLGGNDMRTVVKAESFSIFKALRVLTLPSATPELPEDLCAALKQSLEAVCVESCKNQQHDCPDAPGSIDDLDIVIPAQIPSEPYLEENEDTMSNANKEIGNEETVQTSTATNIDTTKVVESTGESADPGISFRSAVIKAADEESKLPETELKPPTGDAPQLADPTPTSLEPKPDNETKPTDVQPDPTIVDPKPVEPKQTEVEAKPEEQKPTEVAPKLTKEEVTGSQASPNSNIMEKTEGGVAATTSNAKTGGVDKSIIAIVVAGMVLVVAGVTIKKNWSSIRKRFSSSARNDNARTGINSNGTTAPEEVPLQEKSPV